MPLASKRRKTAAVSKHAASEFFYTGKEEVPKDVIAIIISPTVTAIPELAFHNCKHLKSVSLNEGLRIIGKGAFSDCTSLQSVRIPSTVTEIGEEAFWGATSLVDVVLNEGLLKIGATAFAVCMSIERIAIPSTVKQIDRCAFQQCCGMKSLVLNEGILKIGGFAFYECSHLENITIPSTMKEVEGFTFDMCSRLNAVVFNEGLQYIKKNAFGHCASLEKVEFPLSLVYIGPYSFSECWRLREVVMNDGLEKLEYRTFSECLSLETIKLPRSLLQIGPCAFCGCTGLREVTLNEGIQFIGRDAFHECHPSLDCLKVPYLAIRLEAIRLDRWHTEIRNKINELPGVESRGGEFVFSRTPLRGGAYFTSLKENLQQVLGLITYYDLKEVCVVFELALWKTRLEENKNIEELNRETCRVEVPDPVKEAIMQFFPYNGDRGLCEASGGSELRNFLTP
mmetsp:Transcript_8234/g.20254  ORF Transcript_8234/g.20254 Transcript_8234/m.20254 type:complete len:453 (-) Transcript_8234:187-1545(-)